MDNGRVVTVRCWSKTRIKTKNLSRLNISLVLALCPLLLLNGCAGLVSGQQQSASASFAVSPQSVNFGKVAAGQKTSQNVMVTNTGNAAITLEQATFSNSQFGMSGMTLPATMAAGQSSNITVWMSGTKAGTVSGTMSVQGDAGTAPTVVNLSGTVTATAAPQVSLNSTSIDFGTVSVGSKGTTNLVVSNGGTADLVISLINVNGAEFGISGIATPRTVSAGQSISASVTFSPTATGSATGGIAITSNDPTTPTTNVTLTGNGTTAALGQLSASPTNVGFGNVASGSSASQNVTLTNTGSAAVKISSVVAAGTGFSASGVAVPATLNPSQTATLAVKFAPASVGNATGTITIANNGSGPALVIGLTGTGTAAPAGKLTASTTSLSFGTVATGSNAAQSITLTNSGNAAVHISSVVAAGTGFTVSGLTTPAILNTGQAATLSVKFAPTTPGNATGTVKVTSDAPGSPLTINLSGTGAQAGLSVSPASFNFGSIVDGQTKSQNFTLTNTGTAALTVTQISATGAGYSASGLSTPATIAAGKTATFSVLFAPTTAGTLNGSVSIASNAPNSPNAVALSGSGIAASVTISANPSSVSFGSVTAGSSSTKSVTVTNSGNSNMTISQVSVNAKDVTATGITTPVTLAPGKSAAMSLAFSPKSAETVTGNVTVTSSQGSSAVIPVSASAVQAGVTITPSSVNFGNVTVGEPNSQTMQLSNSGTGVLTVTQLSVTGSGFTSSSVNLPLSLNPGTSSTFNVQFAPQTAGSVTGSVSIVSNAPTSPSMVALSGNGIAATATISLSASSLSFGSLTTGNAATQNVTITDTGNANVTISGISIAGAGFTLSGAGTPVTLSPSQKLTIGVQFSPSSAGSVTGSVTIASNATGSPATVSLSGTGVASAQHSATLNWNASTSSVSGYNVYRSTVSGSGYTKVNSSLVGGVTYTDSSVQSGQTYYYVTTAVDSDGDESSYSNEAQAVIP
jgi:hypothetical protein